MKRPWKSPSGTSQSTPFRDGKTDVAARGLVEPRRVADESLEFGKSPILSAAIDIEDAHQTPTTEGPTRFPKGENFRGIANPGSADGAVPVATVEVHRAPPRIASTRSQTTVETTRRPKARIARAETRDWIRFMGLFSVRIGRGDGENEVDDEMPFVAVAIRRNGHGGVIAKNCDAVEMRVPVDVIEGALDPADGIFDAKEWDCNADATGCRD